MRYRSPTKPHKVKYNQLKQEFIKLSKQIEKNLPDNRHIQLSENLRTGYINKNNQFSNHGQTKSSSVVLYYSMKNTISNSPKYLLLFIVNFNEIMQIRTIKFAHVYTNHQTYSTKKFWTTNDNQIYDQIQTNIQNIALSSSNITVKKPEVRR